jgi:hypothetical protein
MKAGVAGAVLAAALVVAAAAPGASDVGRWKLIRSKTSSGQFTVTGTSATVTRPKGIAVRFVGKGLVVWGCSKGFSVSSWSRHYSRLLRLALRPT